MVAAVLYVLSPVDLIPDFFVLVGWLDDAAVVLYAAYTVVNELNRVVKRQSLKRAPIPLNRD